MALVDNEQIHAINLEQRQIDAPTDVLSFPLGEDGVYDQNPAIGTRMITDEITAWWYKTYPQYRRYTSSIKYDGTHLFIALKSAALKHTLSMSRGEIIKTINSFLGSEQVRFLYFL